MKGGRTAPRKMIPADRTGKGGQCFNEGGADCPPKGSMRTASSILTRRFNEGGADCPPKVDFKHLTELCENASMKGGRTAPRKAC